MFDTTFSHITNAPLPAHTPPTAALPILHDFNTIIHFNPDSLGCQRLSPAPADPADDLNHPIKYEVQDSIAFIPKRLWSGGVKYNATFTPLQNGCDIEIFAPGGFTSMNSWRLVRVDNRGGQGNEEGEGWVVEIKSDAKCSKTFAGVVKGFIKTSHVQQQKAFKEQLEKRARPGLGRRRSSWPAI